MTSASATILGDALTVLAGLPAESVHCVVTSPPYYGLRDYGVDGQIGLETTPASTWIGWSPCFAKCGGCCGMMALLAELGDSYAPAMQSGAGAWRKNIGARR